MLSKLSRRYNKIYEMHGELSISDKQNFLEILKSAKAEVDEGFQILARFEGA